MRGLYVRFLKRVVDVVLVLISLPVLLPVVMIAALLIRLEDNGPVLYLSERLGKNGKVFLMYKLRSMKNGAPDIRNADGSTFSSRTDPRVTRIGGVLRRTSIDEIPQVLNVLKGQMSLVGPRPDLPEHLVLYSGSETRKLDVLPGLTGFSQAYYRNAISWKKRLENDVYYVEHMSALLDLAILAKTIVSVASHRGVFSEESSFGNDKGR